MRAAAFAAIAGALLAFGSTAARAESPPPRIALQLSYTLGPGARRCPPEQALHDEVARRLGYDPFTSAPRARERVVVRLNRAGLFFSGVLEIFDSNGKRRWKRSYAFQGHHDHDCAALDAAMGVDISYAFIRFSRLPPAAAPGRPAPANSPPPAPPAEPPAPPPQPPAQAPPPRPWPPARASPPAPARNTSPSPGPGALLELGVGPLVALGVEPTIDVGGVFHVGVRLPSWSLALEARGDAFTSGELSSHPRAAFKAALRGGSLVPCYHHGFFVGCVAVTAGWVRAETPSLITEPAVHAGYVGVGARAGAEIPLAKLWQPMAIRVYGEGLFSVVTPRAVFKKGEVWHAWPASFDVGATLLFRFRLF